MELVANSLVSFAAGQFPRGLALPCIARAHSAPIISETGAAVFYGPFRHPNRPKLTRDLRAGKTDSAAAAVLGFVVGRRCNHRAGGRPWPRAILPESNGLGPSVPDCYIYWLEHLNGLIDLTHFSRSGAGELLQI